MAKSMIQLVWYEVLPHGPGTDSRGRDKHILDSANAISCGSSRAQICYVTIEEHDNIFLVICTPHACYR